MGYVRRTRPQGPPQAITLSQVEIGHGDHVALADVVVTTIFLKSGLEDLGRLLLIQNGYIMIIQLMSLGTAADDHYYHQLMNLGTPAVMILATTLPVAPCNCFTSPV